MLRAIRRFSITPTRMTHKFTPAPRLSLKDINQNTVEAQYAVRGQIPILAEELNKELKQGKSLPFDHIINANIGNPQQLKQKPLTWYRQGLSILQYPELAEQSSLFPKDVIERAKHTLEQVGSIGAYSHSKGAAVFRDSVAKFIENRDGFPSDPEHIYLTSGASAAVSYLLQVLTQNDKSGFLIPIPQYPLYTATIALNNAVPVGYFLDEKHNWKTDSAAIRKEIAEQKSKGIELKALVVINPGNPTGAILEEEDIRELIDIAAEHGLVVIADEVYQVNVFHGKFVSFKQVLSQMKKENEDLYKNVQLASLHSTSKGVSGECGQRGGYMELVGFDPEVEAQIYKLASINLCSVVGGQALVELMVNPPKKGDPSYDTYQQEVAAISHDLQERADKLYAAFEKMEDLESQKPQGAMYLFPSLKFTPETYPKLFKEAKDTNQQVDDIYAKELLKSAGICCVPGNGFGQVTGTYHLRTTFLAPGTEWVDSWAKFHQEFVAQYKQK
ncbi:hypothetical protein DICA1_F33738 [Diutina catenulata]